MDLAHLTVHQWILGFSTLLAFSQLQTLNIFHPEVEDSDIGFALPQLHHLTELRIFRPEFGRSLASLNSVTALTGLRSFLFEVPVRIEVAPERATFIAAMTQLTSLGLKGELCGLTLHCLTALVDLSIDDESWNTACLSDVTDAISCMHHLTSLRLCDLVFKLTSATLKPLTKLKRLILANLSIEPDFVKALMTMPDLTELRFRPGFDTVMDPNHFYAQLGLLTNLVVLEMPGDLIKSDDLPSTGTLRTCVRSLGNQMVHLRKLQLCFRLMTARTLFDSFGREMETLLMNDYASSKAFPNLRRVSITRLFLPQIAYVSTFFDRTCCSDLFI